MTNPEPRSLRDRINAGGSAFGVFLNLGSPAAAAICSQAGLDWILIDLEHGSGSEASLVGDIQAARTGGAAVLVRVESNERLRASRTLDLGADGVMVPRIEDASDARIAVSNLRFPPRGRRGVALMTPAAGFGRLTVVELVNSADPLGIIQIETESAVADADGIAAIDGVDVLFVGPADLSTALGQPGRLDHQTVRAAMAAVVAATEANGKTAGILVPSVDAARTYIDLGFRFIGIGSDASHLATAVRGIRREMDEMPTTK